MKLNHSIGLIAASCTLFACTSSDNMSSSEMSVTTPDYPAAIILERGGFTPEGIEYDNKNQRFMLGSVVEGRVFAVDSNGRMTTIVDDPDLSAVVGIEIEEDRNRILLANADASVFAGDSLGHAELGIYDLDDGSRIALVDLAAAYPDAPEGTRFFPNDIVGDSEGNVYITDSFAVVVYKVDTNMQASVFVSRDKFPEDQSINGIISHPDGYLIIAGSGTGALYKVDLRNPENFRTIGLPEPIAGADGMVWASDGSLVIAAQGRTVALRSGDNWISAQIQAQVEQGAASTVATVGEDSYLIFPHFADQDAPTIQRVNFGAE